MQLTILKYYDIMLEHLMLNDKGICEDRKQMYIFNICKCACVLNLFSCVQLFVTQWTVVHQASLSIGLSRQE